MTSGAFTSFPVSSIFVNRELRQRRELTGIEELADSIRRIGLINPLTIERSGELRAGERRLTAVRLLGWTHVSVQFIDEVDESALQVIELEENIRRVNIEWKDECLAVHNYHSLMKRHHSDGWTEDQTGSALGMTTSAVNQKLGVARELLAGTKLVVDAPKFSTARGIVTRLAERRADAEEEALFGPPPEKAKPEVPLLLADFKEWASAYSGRKFNFLHCDFPYGIDADSAPQSQAALLGGYADSAEVYFSLLSTLAQAMNNVVADSAHLMFWFSMDYYHETLSRLSAMGWSVNPFPLIWFKSDNTGILPDPARGPRRVYETALLASRGDRKIIRAVSNVCAWPGQDKAIHMSEKPVGMLSHFFRMFVDEHTIFLDPTAGSGNAVKTAERAGAGAVLGIEQNVEFYSRAVEAYHKGDEVELFS